MSRFEDQISGSLISTVFSESSSGIPDCDLTILSDEVNSKHISNVENELRKRNYTIASIVPAGREVHENIASRIKHSQITVIVITKQNSRRFQKFLEYIPAKSAPGSLDIAKTLILVENETKLFKRFYNFIQLLLPRRASDIANRIHGFKNALKIYKEFGNTASNLISFKKFYGGLLLHSVINPLRSNDPLFISIESLQTTFSIQYGSFCNFFEESLETCLTNNPHFLVKNSKVSQTKSGAYFAHKWWKSEILQKEVDGKVFNCQPHISTTADVQTLVSHCSNNNHLKNWVKNECKNAETNWEDVEPLENLHNEFDHRYSFFLILSKSTPPDKSKGICKVPWLKVFDFNSNSRESGLLSSVENEWKEKRSISISTCLSNSPVPLSYDATDWLFPLGFSDQSESLYVGTPLAWFNENKPVLELTFSSIADFCSLRTKPVFYILWYDDQISDVSYLDWLFSVLYPAFKSNTVLPVKVILCTNKICNVDNSIKNVIRKYELSEATVHRQAETVYKWLAEKSIPERPPPERVLLPGENETIVELKDKPLSIWIRKYIEMLSLESQDQIQQRKTEDFGKEFVKGGVISWDELASNDVAVQRHKTEDVYKFLETEVIGRQKSIVLRLLHAPGGGGTTISRQILWSLHKKVPCGVVVPNFTLSIAHISESVSHINRITHLPVVLLIDGCSEYEVNQLYENCKYAIVILHVQRCNQKISENNYSEQMFRLSGKVTPKEAKELTKVFSNFSPPNCHDTLKALTRDVNDKKEKFVFEYGLAAFHHEFKGVQKYVQGYLNMRDQMQGMDNWKTWQKVIAYLSLALYYGQCGLHRETFHNILKKDNRKEFVTLDDLDYSGQQFLNEKKNEWKISYNIVAKEILEQLLSSPGKLNERRYAELSKQAGKSLDLLVIDFIQMIKDASKESKPEFVLQLLSNMIIRRDYKEVDKSDGIRAKCVLSKLLEDIPETEKRVRVLTYLKDAFPHKPEFHAHLGRLLNLNNRFKEAELSLQKALDIRTRECARLKPGSCDDMLSRIHHMFGHGYTRNAKLELKEAIKIKSETAYSTLLNLVKKAVDHFMLVRRYATHNLSYGYIGEVRVRLLAAEYVHVKFSGRCRDAFENKLGEKHFMLSDFIRESHSVCDRLLAECVHYTSQQELKRIDEYKKCIENFIMFFSDIEKNVSFWESTKASIPMRRSHIASLKLTQKPGNGYSISIENVLSRDDLQLIIQLYERTFRDVFDENFPNARITIDVLEWLEAIRHPWSKQKVSLAKVLDIVEQWESRNESSYGTFYLYVINFLLALFSPGRDLNKECYEKSKRCREKLQVQRQKCDLHFWRLEWIACHKDLTTIRTIVHRNNLGSWDKDKRFWKEERHIQKLKVFTGTVVSSSHPLKGNISLDVAQAQYNCRMEIYFVPKLYKLNKSIYAEQKLRVEFCIGFGFHHGAEAFMIKPLHKRFCMTCNMQREYITINAGPDGKCRKCNP